MPIPINGGLGWLPDLPDIRDHRYSAPRFGNTEIPSHYDFRHMCPPVYNQGNLGSCTGQALCGMFEYHSMLAGKQDFNPSPLFIYYNEREIEGTIEVDCGARIRTGMKVLNNLGVCNHSLWPYLIEKFKDKPDAAAYNEASYHQAIKYSRVPRDLFTMKSFLANGLPFVFGFSVYDSFYSHEVATKGVVPLPQSGESLIGGHAVMAVGYDDASQSFTVRNSWGDDWGVEGYFYLPYAFLADPHLSQDFWVLELAE